MENLNLPVFNAPLPETKKLSMDDYLKFVLENLRLFKEEKELSVRRLTPVNARFIIQ